MSFSFCDFHSDGWLDHRDPHTKDLPGRHEQTKGIEKLELIYVALFIEHFPMFKEQFESRQEAQKAYHQKTLELGKSIDRSPKMQVVRCKKDLTLPGLRTILHVEGLNTVTSEKTFSRLDELWNLGIRSMGPIYAHEKKLGGGNRMDPNIGLTDIGKLVIEKMWDLGMVLDLAHCNEKTKDDILALKMPKKTKICYTHGAVLDDKNESIRYRAIRKEQALEVIRRGGIIGISVATPFVASVDHFIEQICMLGEINNFEGVCVGTDFGGITSDTLIDSLRNYEEVLDFVPKKLKKAGVSNENIKKVMGGNVWRFTEGFLPEC